MKDLVGKRVRIEFDMDPCNWPIPGFPAWADCLGYEHPLIRLDDMWVNISCIRNIREWGKAMRRNTEDQELNGGSK